MGLCTEAPRVQEPQLNDLGGVEFQHDLHLVVRDWAAWTAVSDRLARAGANIHALHIARGGEQYQVHCRLEQISAEDARGLTSAFLDEGVAERGNVEHLLCRKALRGEGEGGALKLSRSQVEEDIALPVPADFRLSSGDALPDAHILLRRLGAREGPQIAALGGISSGRDVCGAAGWWRETLVDHRAIDLNQFGVIGVDFAPISDCRVQLAPSDQARLILHALAGLGVGALHAFVGASYGGLVALAFAALAPKRLERLCVISAAHRPAAQALAWRGVQRRIVEYGIAQGHAAGAFALARQLAMITYRTAAEFDARFGVGLDAHGRGVVDRYLESRGEAYAQVALPQRWLTLSEAVDRAFVDPRTITARTTLIASLDDQLVPEALVHELAEQLANLSALHTLPSIYGHDAFLKEPARLAPIIAQCLKEDAHV